MEILILAGGLGTRLRSEVNHLPKVLAPINNKPFIDILIKQITNYNKVLKIHFSLCYLSDLIINHLKKNHSEINYTITVEQILLGTGGAIKLCSKNFTKEDVLIINGDTFFDIDFKDFFDFHKNNLSDCTVAVKKMENVDRYGSINFDKESFVINEFVEKKFIKSGYINGGYILIKKDKLLNLFSRINKIIFPIEEIIFNLNLDKYKLMAYPSNSMFIDIGIPEDFKKAQEIFK